MARKKPNRSKQNKQIKSQLGKLKKAGLYSGDLRKQPTDYAKRLVKRKDMQPVLQGEAKVAKIPTQSAKASLKKQGFSVKNSKVIVPSGDRSERIYVSRKTGRVVRSRSINGERITIHSATGKEKGGRYYLVTAHMQQLIGDKSAVNQFTETYKTKWPDVSAYIYHANESFDDDGEYDDA